MVLQIVSYKLKLYKGVIFTYIIYNIYLYICMNTDCIYIRLGYIIIIDYYILLLLIELYYYYWKIWIKAYLHYLEFHRLYFYEIGLYKKVIFIFI